MAKKGGGAQTVTNTLDPQTQAMQRDVYNAARAAAGLPPLGGSGVAGMTGRQPGESIPEWMARVRQSGGDAGPGAPMGEAPPVDPLIGQTLDFYKGLLADGGANPYQSEVIERTMGDYGRLADSARMNINDQATRAGAFGGGRHGVAEGVALGDIARAQGDQIAGLRFSGFNEQMARRFGAAGMIPGLLDMNDPNLRRQRILQGGLTGMPYGTTTSQPYNKGNLGANILGGAGIGAQFGPWGAVAGGVGGGILGSM